PEQCAVIRRVPKIFTRHKIALYHANQEVIVVRSDLPVALVASA
ncbi:MAG: hypothetical protein ACI96P_001788, partial [Candidatus Azotimanducaceae bacterium]